MRILFVYLVITANILFAKTIIDFENLSFISKNFARSFVDIKENNNYSSKQINNKINQSIKSLYALNYFKDIWVEKKRLNKQNTKYTFYFVPRNNIKSITFKGYLNSDNSKEITSSLPIKESSTYTDIDILKTKKYIKQHMLKKDFFDSQISFDIKNTNNNSDITINTNEGTKVVLDNIYINGNKKISKDTLQKKMLLKKKDIFHYIPIFFNDGILNTQALEFNSQALRDFYLQNGFFDFELISHKLVVDFDTYRASLFITIEEGHIYTISNSDIVYMDRDISEDIKQEITDSLLVQKSNIIIKNDIAKDIENIKNTISNKGYAFANVSPDIIKKDSNISIIYRVYAGNIITINDVFIEGNTKTLDHVIRRELFLAPEDIFSQSEYTQSILALKRTGYFEDVSIEKKKVGSNKIDLIVKIEESKGTNISAGGGHGSQDGWFVSGSWKTLNIFGSGIKSTFSGHIGQSKSKFNYTVDNPRLFNSLYSGSFNIYDIEDDAIDYNKSSVGASVSFGKKITRFMNFSANIKTDTSDVTSLDTNTTSKFLKNSISLNTRFNNANNFLHPSSGGVHNLSLTYNGIGGGIKYSKISAKTSFFNSLNIYKNKDIIFSYKTVATYLVDNNIIPSHERLTMGGMSSIKGYTHGSIYPRDGNIKGGTQMMSSNIDISFPINKSMRFSIFADYGMIGNSSIDEIQRGSYGATIQLLAGGIPIVFAFPVPFLHTKEDKTKSFEFSIGNGF